VSLSRRWAAQRVGDRQSSWTECLALTSRRCRSVASQGGSHGLPSVHAHREGGPPLRVEIVVGDTHLATRNIVSCPATFSSGQPEA
jgi:hypothetical protein